MGDYIGISGELVL